MTSIISPTKHREIWKGYHVISQIPDDCHRFTLCNSHNCLLYMVVV